MAEKNNHSSHSAGLISRKFKLFMFTLTTFLFIFSWFFVLRSTGQPQLIDYSLLPTSRSFATIDNGNSQSRNQNDVVPSFPESSNAMPHTADSIPNTSDSLDQNEKAPVKNDVVVCDSNKEVLKVFMYDLHPEFHFELLDWKAEGKSVWPDIQTKIPDYPGGLNLQHSIEYWLTLDLLSLTIPDRKGPRSAIRVHNSSDADVIFVPFFSSLCYNRNSKVRSPHKKSTNNVLQEKLVRWLTNQEEWKRPGGRDHIVMAHHPNSMLDARMKLWSAMFILSDFGRYPPNIANVEKDLIAPYKHVIRTFFNDSSGFDDRPTLLYFQ